MAKHLAVFDLQTANLIFSGKKKIEGRFSKIKIAPFGKVKAEDAVLIKVSGEKVVGQFVVDRVFCFDHPNLSELEEIRTRYLKDLRLPSNFWLDHEKVNYATLMFIRSVTKFLIPPQIPKKDLRPWVVLE